MHKYNIIAMMCAVKKTSIVQCHRMSCRPSYLLIYNIPLESKKDAFMPSQNNKIDINLFSNPLVLARQISALKPTHHNRIRTDIHATIMRNPKRLCALNASA